MTTTPSEICSRNPESGYNGVSTSQLRERLEKVGPVDNSGKNDGGYIDFSEQKRWVRIIINKYLHTLQVLFGSNKISLRKCSGFSTHPSRDIQTELIHFCLDVEMALESLSDGSRSDGHPSTNEITVFKMYFFEGLSLRNISKCAGLTYRAVRRNLQEATSRIWQRLADYDRYRS